MTTIVLDSDSDSCDTVVAGTSGSPFVSSGKPSKTVKVEPTPGLNNGVVDLTEEEEEEEESEATDDSADEAPKTRPSAPQRNGGSTLQPTTMPPQGNQTPQNGTCDVSGETSEEEDEAPRGIKRSLEPSDSTPGAGGEPGNPSKKPALQEDDPSTDDSEDEGWRCASWKVQEEMVKRLKRHFPRKTTEELRVELVWHQWQFDKTLQALRLVAEEVSSSEEGPSNQDDEVPSTSSVSSPPADRPTTSTNTANPPPPHRHIPNGSTTNSSGRAGRPATSETDSWSLSGTNGQIFRFFQEATKDELCLMHRCSEKKAEKIIQLRPYKNWDSLLVALKQTSGLTVELLQGCRLVLKEQQVVHGLMKECEVISRTMMDHVTQVVESTRSHYKQQPPILNSECQMKSYQLFGLNWLHLLHENNVSGILADEMGLGKTVQAIAFLASLYEEGNTGPHLIIVPGSTLDNWVRELTLWCPSLKVFTYNGSVEERRSMHLQLLKEAGNYNIIISTYKMAVNNSNDRSLFRKLSLEYAVFDEGHVLKNMRSQRYRHLMDINAKYRLLLTGTPMQNNLLELMSLLNFIMPEMFSSSTTEMFKMFNVFSNAQKVGDEQSSFEKERINHAKLIIKPFILRRIKSEVLQQLPAKEQKVSFCSMSEKQKQLYDTLLQKLKGSNNGEKRELSNVMMHLRKMANHPLMHLQYYTPFKLEAISQLITKEPSHHDANPELVLEDMKLMNDFELHRLCQRYPSLQDYQLDTDLLLDSGKLCYLTELLAMLKSQGDRVVLFSQFTMMLDILEVFLQHHQYRFIRLDGSTPMSDRIGLIDQFNSEMDVFVFLLSTKAGGLGINLTSANVVILHDIDCNPYNDKQAEDRCHRVGQTRVVKVHKLISEDTIEDAMLRISQKKLKLEQDMTTAQEGEEGSIPEDMASALKALLGL